MKKVIVISLGLLLSACAVTPLTPIGIVYDVVTLPFEMGHVVVKRVLP